MKLPNQQEFASFRNRIPPWLARLRFKQWGGNYRTYYLALLDLFDCLPHESHGLVTTAEG